MKKKRTRAVIAHAEVLVGCTVPVKAYLPLCGWTPYGIWKVTSDWSTPVVEDLCYLYAGNICHTLNKWDHRNHDVGGSGTSFLLTLFSLFTFLRSLAMPPQGLPLSRMAPLGMLLGLLIASCFTFCLSRQNPVSILSQVERSLLGPRKPPCQQGCLGNQMSFYFSYRDVASTGSWSMCTSSPAESPLASV